MIIIRTPADLARALDPPVDESLGQILRGHRDWLGEYDEFAMDELAYFLVVLPGEACDDVERALGFSITTDRDNGARFGDPSFVPDWEHIELHYGWFELTFVLGDDGFGWVVLIKDDPGVAPELLSLCRTYADEA